MPGVTAVSADRRFATAYNAALLTAHMVIACAGYRVTAKTGHDKVALDSIRLSANASNYADYFERCRRKRNVIDYTRSHAATETEAQEILEKATEFHGFVEAWIDSNYRATARCRARSGVAAEENNHSDNSRFGINGLRPWIP